MNVREITEKESEYIWYLKAIAIFCVVCAHISTVPEVTTGFNNLISDILHYIGTMGVPIFFIVSGFLFAGSKKNFGIFWKDKVFSVIIPWIFCYTLLYFYIIIRKGGFSLHTWFQTVFGFYSSSYYMVMLIVFYLIFWKLRSNIFYMGIMAALSIFSILCTGWEFGIEFINHWCGTYYLNPLNWAVFFIAGIFWRKSKYKFTGISYRLFPVCLFFSVLYYIIMEVSGEAVWYFSKYSLIGNCINILFLFSISNFFLTKKCGWVKKIGYNSYSIYLTNQFFAGGVIFLTNKSGIAVFTLIRPILVIIIIMVGIQILTKILKQRGSLLYMLIGIRAS